MEDTDFDIICEGASPAEAKQLRKLLADWYDGEENSFPVQLVLLTRAQWRIAASIPLLVKDSTKLLDAKLGQFRQEITAGVLDFKTAVESQLQAVKELQKAQTREDRETQEAVRSHLAEISAFAKLMEDNIRRMGDEAQRSVEFCHQERDKLETTFKTTKFGWNIRQIVLVIALMLALSGIGLLLGHFVWH